MPGSGPLEHSSANEGGAETARVHGYHQRAAVDVPVGGRRVVVWVRLRRMRCPALGCQVQTFREQVPGVLERCQRRISRLTAQVSAVARELAGPGPGAVASGTGRHGFPAHRAADSPQDPLPSVAVPQAAQVSDRWHLWHLLGGVAAGDARTPRGVAGAGKFARQAVAASSRAP
jgi:zinc-finger of transposase IS204/IS1001/IS1096/IS1165